MYNRRKGRRSHPFTVSRLQALRLCPYRYHLQYELGIRVGGRASRQGIALHAAVAGSLLRWGKTTMETEVAKAVDQKPIDARDRARVLELAKGFQTLMAPHIKQVLAVEKPITVAIEHIAVVGRVDTVVETDRGLELWDLKTARRRGYLDAFPLGVYALGVKGMLGRVPDWWAYINLGQGNAEVYMGGEEMASGVIDEARQTARRLLLIAPQHPNPGAWCRSCPYRRWCPVTHPQPEPLPTHQPWLWSGLTTNKGGDHGQKGGNSGAETTRAMVSLGSLET